jgi:hypothetical protein
MYSSARSWFIGIGNRIRDISWGPVTQFAWLHDIRLLANTIAKWRKSQYSYNSAQHGPFVLHDNALGTHCGME